MPRNTRAQPLNDACHPWPHVEYDALCRDDARRLHLERAMIRMIMAGVGFVIACLIVWLAAGGIAATLPPAGAL